MKLKELLKRAYALELGSCKVGILSRQGKTSKVVVKPLACYVLYKNSLVDPWDTQIPLHRVYCLECEHLRLERCPDFDVRCEELEGGWVKAVACECEDGYAVRGPRGYDPVYALRGPPYPLMYSGEVIACVPEGKCEGQVIRRGLWYWYI